MKRTLSPEHRQRIGEATRLRWENPEYRNRVSASMRERQRHLPDETRQLLSALIRGVPLSQSHIEAIRAGKARRKAAKI